MSPSSIKRSAFHTILIAGVALSRIASAHAQSIKVTLLGTGTPIPQADRFGPSTLVEAGSQKLLFDAGRGVPIRLAQIHVPMGQLTAVFLTHLHSDHVVGLPDLWLTGWLANPQFAHRIQAMRVFGPNGTRAMVDGLRIAYQADLHIRTVDEKLPAPGADIVVSEIEQGVVYDSSGVKVTAFTVDHGDSIKPAFGYRVDYEGHSLVLSGDTRPSENLVRFATGVDVLVHEVSMGKATDAATSAALRRVLAHHTSPESAGRIFTRVAPKLAVYSHIGLSSYDPALGPPTLADLLAATRSTYAGRLEIGEDLMSFEIGDSVAVRRFAPPKP